MSMTEDKGPEELYVAEHFSEAIVQAMVGIAEMQMSLSELADSKANIMITVCSILLSLAIAKLEQGVLVIPISAFAAFCVPALIFAILTVMPSAGVHHKPVEHPSKLPHFNPLFFMHASLVPMPVFERTFEQALTNAPQYYRYMARDIYMAGLVLRTKKYRYLRWSYQALMAGIVLGGLAMPVEMLLR